MGVSTFNGINVALRGLIAQQRALDVTTHNIANASTEGYTRQEAVLEAADPISNISVWGMLFPGQLGQGVTVDSYRRIRDVFNDVQLRAASSDKASLDVRYRELHAISLAIPEPSDNGIQSLVQDFFNAWHDVANAPESLAARQSLAQAGQSLTSAFNHASTTFATMRANDNTEIDADIGVANSLLDQIASLNTQIGQLVLAGAQVDPATMQIVKPGQAPNDLLDRRDLLLDKLGQLANVTSVTYDDQNRATVVVAGLTVVTPTAGATAITRAQMDAQFASGALSGGALHALEDAYTNLLNEASATSYPSQLNLLAQSLYDAINAQHALGADLSGTAGGIFFDFTSPAGPPGAAGRLTMSAAILANPTTIAAGATGQGPGSATNANAMVALQNAITTGGTTFLEYYNGMQSGLGTATQSTARSLDAQQIVVGGLSDRRVAASGVSLDEEMTNMIKFQHAYAAASRVLSAMDENLDRLINATGRVGL
ncbi:MAG: flagellar hook-associated protein 1 [Gaiellaceae bacterium]|nr:flagellar hook-associated protein 1 [Gaiellaceae bacterium]